MLAGGYSPPASLRRPDTPTSMNRKQAKFGIAPIQTVQDRRPGNKQVRAARLKGKGRSEDRPNAVTLITLRLLRELRLCQVAISQSPLSLGPKDLP
jgi:hypothetical protein